LSREASWNRWVATNIHLDHLLNKQSHFLMRATHEGMHSIKIEKF